MMQKYCYKLRANLINCYQYWHGENKRHVYIKWISENKEINTYVVI